MTTSLRLYLTAALATVYVAVFWWLRVDVKEPAPAVEARPAPQLPAGWRLAGVEPAPAPAAVRSAVRAVRPRAFRVRTRSS